LSVNLRTFSQQLKSIRLDELVVGSELFWPSSTIPEGPTPHWPYLTSFILNYTRITPSGKWLFESDPSEPVIEYEYLDQWEYMDEDEMPAPEDRNFNLFRLQACAEFMNPLYIAAGHAAANMPFLKEMYLTATNIRRTHCFEYKAAATSAVATWQSNPYFEPSGEVLDTWKQVPKKFLGNELEVHFVKGDDQWQVRQI
jgi:hypothetical protein